MKNNLLYKPCDVSMRMSVSSLAIRILRNQPSLWAKKASVGFSFPPNIFSREQRF